MNNHFVSEGSVLKNSKALEHIIVDTCAGKGTIIVHGDATFILQGIVIKLKYKPVLDFERNVIALSKPINRFDVNFASDEKSNGYKIIDRERRKRALSTERQDESHPFPQPKRNFQRSLFATTNSSTSNERHDKLGHAEVEKMIFATNKLYRIPPFYRNELIQHQFFAFIASKTKRSPLHCSRSRLFDPCYLTHTDMTRKITTRLLESASHFVIFLDDTTATGAVYFVKRRSQIIDCLRACKELVEI